MKVAILSATTPLENTGGLETFVTNLTSLLKSRGHTVANINLTGKVEGHLDLCWRTLKFAFTKHDLSSYDLVITNSHSFRPFIKAKKVVSVWHGSGIQRLITEPKAWFSPFTWLDVKLEVLDLLFTGHIVAVSKTLMDFILRFRGHGVSYTYSPVNPCMKPESTIRSAKKILFVGRPTKSKGFEDLKNAMELLPPDYTLEVAGGLEPNTERRIEYLGVVKQEQLAKLYNEAYCFVLPSHYEGAPLTVLEALSCGCPVVASRVGAIAEMINSGENGYITPVGDVNTLADKIQLVSHIDRRRVVESSHKFSAELIGRYYEGFVEND